MTISIARRLTLIPFSIALIFFFAIITRGQGASAHPSPANESAAISPAIVIGFVGGFIAHDNLVHSEVQLAGRLRKEYPTGVVVETFESYRGERAHQRILKLLDTDQNGTLTAKEKHDARIILYGHSWGGSESIALARALQKDGIPVLLTLQVDSVAKYGRNDTLIPANVVQAVNFYQPHGFVHGDHDIRAVDAGRTSILGNFKFDYSNNSLKCSQYPWYDRIFVKAHTQIECDPMIWARVESLIRSTLGHTAQTEKAQ
jgi:hypothetical protein